MHDAQTLTLAQGPARSEEIARQIEAAVAQARAQARAAETGDAARADAQAGEAQGGALVVPAPPGTVFRVGPDGRLVEVTPGEAPPAPGEAGEVAITLDEGRPPEFIFEPKIPPEAVMIAIASFIMIAVIVIGLPIARALARRMDRSAAPPPRPSAEQAEQLRHIQTAVDAMAVEIERVSENQRYVTRLLAEGASPGAARLEQGARAAEPLETHGERR